MEKTQDHVVYQGVFGGIKAKKDIPPGVCTTRAGRPPGAGVGGEAAPAGGVVG